MRIVAARLLPYALPLVRPWVAASATISVRHGALLALSDADGIVGWGDCAPLPSGGDAGRERALADLAALARGLPTQDVSDALESLATIASPEARWAAETALLDLQARRRGLPLARLLRDDPAETVPVNAALGPLDAECAARAETALDEGYAIGKIKVGLGPLAVEVAALQAVARRTDGRLSLRLDANRAWSESDAHRFLGAVARLPIDGIEEPLASPTPASLARLQAATPCAVAVDESLVVLGADAVLGAVRRLVIKPARVGGHTATLTLAARAREAGMEVVLTSVVDSAVGVAAAAHLAAALPRGAAHGLATLAWLAEDVAEGPSVVAGQLALGPGPGLGVDPRGVPAQG